MGTPGEAERLDRRDAWVGLALGGGAVGLLLAFRALEQTGDSLTYAVSIQTGERLFHPHHLLFSPIVRMLYLLLSTVGSGVDAILAAQIHNALWAATAVAACYLVLRLEGGSRLVGAAAAVSLLAARGVLVFASQVEVYVPALGVAAVLFLFMALERQGTVLPPWAWAAALALLVFYHQSNVLFCVPLALFVLIRGHHWRRVVKIIAPAGAVVLGAYVAVYLARFSFPSIGGFIDYTLRYALSETWGQTENVAASGIEALLDGQMKNLIQLPQGARATGRWVAAGGILVLAGWSLVKVAVDRSRLALRVAAVAWLGVHYGFFLWWQPGQDEFFIITLLPLILLGFVALGDVTEFGDFGLRSGVALAALVTAGGLLLPVNIRGGLAPLRAGPGPAHARAAEMNALAPEGCVILAGRSETHALRYYFGRTFDDTHNVRRRQRQIVAGDEPVEPIPGDACVLVPLHEIERGQRTLAGTGKAAGWVRFLEWTFRLEAEDGRMSAPVLSMVRSSQGAAYALQHGLRVPMHGLEGLCRRLDGGLPGACSKWLDSARGELRRSGLPAEYLSGSADANDSADSDNET